MLGSVQLQCLKVFGDATDSRSSCPSTRSTFALSPNSGDYALIAFPMGGLLERGKLLIQAGLLVASSSCPPRGWRSRAPEDHPYFHRENCSTNKAQDLHCLFGFNRKLLLSMRLNSTYHVIHFFAALASRASSFLHRFWRSVLQLSPIT